jgi:NAD(P)H dehydrogenase (quinone)
MTTASIVFFSGYGHTKKQAEAVSSGVMEIEGVNSILIAIDKDGNISENDWNNLEKSDAIIFGSPTYMGGPAWQFKKFADNSSKPWMKQLWKDKIAAGFTNSGGINGDKFSTVAYLNTFAMQHGMIWIGTGMLPASQKASVRDDINWLGGFSGALAQSPVDASAEEAPCAGDLKTAQLFGKRIAEYAKKTRN